MRVTAGAVVCTVVRSRMIVCLACLSSRISYSVIVTVVTAAAVVCTVVRSHSVIGMSVAVDVIRRCSASAAAEAEATLNTEGFFRATNTDGS